MTPPADTARDKHHRFPGAIISHGVWLYYRFTLSDRDLQELPCERGGPWPTKPSGNGVGSLGRTTPIGSVRLTPTFMPSVPVSRARLLLGPHLHAAHQRHATDVHLGRVGRQALLPDVVGPAPHNGHPVHLHADAGWHDHLHAAHDRHHRDGGDRSAELGRSQ